MLTVDFRMQLQKLFNHIVIFFEFIIHLECQMGTTDVTKVQDQPDTLFSFLFFHIFVIKIRKYQISFLPFSILYHFQHHNVFRYFYTSTYHLLYLIRNYLIFLNLILKLEQGIVILCIFSKKWSLHKFLKNKTLYTLLSIL